MLKLFSADDHIIEPRDVWSRRLPSRFREAGPHIVEADGREYWEYEGQRNPTLGLNAVVGKPVSQWNQDPLRYEDMLPGCYDPKERAKDLISNGILASVCFPSLPRFAGTLFLTFQDRELASLCVTAYNDFVLEDWCPAGPRGLYVPTVICQLWDPALAAGEIRRCAALGARALAFPENTVPLGLPSYFTDHWDPVWRACEETGVALCLHIGTSGKVPQPTPEAPLVLTFSLLQVGSIEASVNLMMSPVCRKFPGLKFVFSEGGIGWLPNAIERADRMYLRHRAWSGTDDILPSDIYKQNMYLCMIEEPVCLKYVDDIGADHIVWECDYPHADTVWPDTQDITGGVFQQAGISAEAVEKISYRNAERIFNWTIADAPDEPSESRRDT
jgi:predicted TIM-barrel fold metal-dependent hydrolase